MAFYGSVCLGLARGGRQSDERKNTVVCMYQCIASSCFEASFCWGTVNTSAVVGWQTIKKKIVKNHLRVGLQGHHALLHTSMIAKCGRSLPTKSYRMYLYPYFFSRQLFLG